MSHNLPDRFHGGSVQRDDPERSPARRPAAPQVHEARKLDFVQDHDREYWWNELSDKVKAQIADKAGPAIEWWAYRHGVERERAYAVVLGPHALVVTTPLRSNTGSPVQRVRPYRLVPGSLRYAPVRQHPSPPRAGSGGPATAPSGPGTAPPSPGLAISADLRGFLGNLPAEAQQRMQGPFAAGDPVVDSDYFYHGSAEDLNMWCYLAGQANVMFLSGRRVGPAGPPHLASWDLICRHARVATG